MQPQPYRVLYTTPWGIRTSKVFPNQEQAEEFAKTVRDPLVQDVREPVPYKKPPPPLQKMGFLKRKR